MKQAAIDAKKPNTPAHYTYLTHDSHTCTAKKQTDIDAKKPNTPAHYTYLTHDTHTCTAKKQAAIDAKKPKPPASAEGGFFEELFKEEGAKAAH